MLSKVDNQYIYIYTLKSELQNDINNHTHIIVTLEEIADPGYNLQLKYHIIKEDSDEPGH